MFKPSTDSARLLVQSQKKFQFWICGSLGGTLQMVVFPRFYGLLYTALDAHRMAQHFGSSMF